MKTLAWLIFAWAWVVSPVSSSPRQSPAPSATEPQIPYVEFHFDWVQGRPWTVYTISVEETGKTHYHGTGNAADAGDGDVFDQNFQMTEANRQKIFEWAKAANYFRGNFEVKQKNIAKTGEKTLTYRGNELEGSTTYNYSRSLEIQQLTKLFQAIAMTLDYGRRLAYQYRFDKLGMDARLNELTDLQKSGFVEELQAIEPILQKIAEDPNIMHISRQQAKQLLKSASGGTQQAPAQP